MSGDLERRGKEGPSLNRDIVEGVNVGVGSRRESYISPRTLR